MLVWSFKKYQPVITMELNKKPSPDWERLFVMAMSWEMADAFFLEAQRNNQPYTLDMDSAKGKAGEKGCIFIVLRR